MGHKIVSQEEINKVLMLYEKLKSVVKISVALDMKETTIRNRLKAGGVRLEGNRKVKKIEGVIVSTTLAWHEEKLEALKAQLNPPKNTIKVK